MKAGNVQALLIYGANPAYDLPPSADFAAAIARVPFVISFAPIVDETGARIADQHDGILAVRNLPEGGVEFSLALPAGHYAVERRSKDGRAQGDIDLVRGADLLLPKLAPTRYELARSKGGPLPTEWFAGFGVASWGMPSFGFAPAFRGGFRREIGQLAVRFHGDYMFKDVNEGAFHYGYSRIGAGAALLTPVFGSKRLVEAGVDLGYGYASQSLRDGRHFNAHDLTGGLAVVASAPIGRMRIAFDGMFGGTAFKLDRSETVKPVAIASVVLLYGF